MTFMLSCKFSVCTNDNMEVLGCEGFNGGFEALNVIIVSMQKFL